MKPLLPILILLSPLPATAAVVINEVAWMGSVTSANHEWIELHNTGAAVDVTGWTLTDGTNLTISLGGTIDANAYAVLERTSDESAPGPAFLTYTGALANTGATLTLRRADNSIEDQVAGGTDWSQLGGDNTTKHTAQYTSTGWITAAPTAGMQNATQSTVSSPSTTQSVTTSVSTSNNSGGSKLATPVARPEVIQSMTLPNTELRLAVSGPTIGYVHQPLEFSVVPDGIGKTLLNSVTYTWNLGDGTTNTKTGKSLNHVFTHPGRYVVSVYGNFSRHDAEARHEVTILPVSISLTLNQSGDVQINNDAQYDIPLDGYRLRGEQMVTFSPRTYLLPQQTITIPAERLGATHTVTLADTENAVVAVLGHRVEPVVIPKLISVPAVEYVSPPMIDVSVDTPSPSEQRFGFATTLEPVNATEPARVATNTPVITRQKNDNLTPSWWPYVGLGILILGAAGLLLVQPKRSRGSSNTHD